MVPIGRGPAAADSQAHPLQFDCHRLAGPHGPLSSSGREVKLTPKALALLWTLASHPGRVLTKAALLDAVWGEIAVGEDALGFQIRALRQALRDDPRQSRYIETVHRIGYRFIAQVGVAPAAGVETTAPRPVLCDAGCERTASTVIGRGDEIARLDDLLTRTLEGRRQMAFVTGEAGIGKTALLEAFLASHKGSPFLVARGQSVEHYGAGEPLLPLLDAVSRLCRQPGGDRALGVLRRHAPSWLAHLPALWPAADREASPQMAPRVTRERMLRELCDALEVLTSVQPVVLLLEDLHWADPSTVEWLAMVARRPEAARLLVLGTYRPADLLFRAHPLKAAKQELVARGPGDRAGPGRAEPCRGRDVRGAAPGGGAARRDPRRPRPPPHRGTSAVHGAAGGSPGGGGAGPSSAGKERPLPRHRPDRAAAAARARRSSARTAAD